MVPPSAPRTRLRLEILEDRLTLGDAGPLAAAVLSAVGVSDPAKPGLADADKLGDVLGGQTAGAKVGGLLGSGSIFGPAQAVSSEASTRTGPGPVRGRTDDAGPALLPAIGFADPAADAIGPVGVLPAGIDVTRSVAAVGTAAPAPAGAPAPVVAVAAGVPPAGGAGGLIGPVAPQPTPPPAATQVSRLTATNRNAVTMSGGWNPALRGILVMNDGSRWFAAETGTDVQVNSAMVYYRLGPTGWRAVGSVALPAGIQQNMATITNGRVIYSYGCTRSSVIETWFDTSRPRWNLSTGNVLTASGVPINPGAAANYIGAAWRNGARVVWWTSVGAAGASGKWSYAYTGGRGWNGPVVSDLGGFNDVGYVRARFDDRGRLRLSGEGYVGEFPNGRRYMVAATVVLGSAALWVPILPAVARSPLDLWRVDAGSHFLYATATNQIGYSFGASGSRPTFFKAMQARFISAGDRLGLILADQRSVEVRLVPLAAAAAGRIDWAAVAPIKIDLPAPLRAAGVSAIWTADESRQPHGSDRLEFAIAGGYPTRDNLIYYVTLDAGQQSRGARIEPVRG
jgi:hypothetical protein